MLEGQHHTSAITNEADAKEQHEATATERQLQEQLTALSARFKEMEQSAASGSQTEEDFEKRLAHEKQKEKDRSIAMLKRKDQEVQIKDQQLKAAKQRVKELEDAAASSAVCAACGNCIAKGSTEAAASPTAGRRDVAASSSAVTSLPPLPTSAR